MCIRDSNRNIPNNNRPNDSYRGAEPEQRTNGHPNNHNYYGNRYNPSYQYNRGPGGNQNRGDGRRQVNFIHGRRQSNHRRYGPNWHPNPWYHASNHNNNQSSESMNNEPPRDENNQQQGLSNETNDQSNSLATNQQPPLN